MKGGSQSARREKIKKENTNVNTNTKQKTKQIPNSREKQKKTKTKTNLGRKRGQGKRENNQKNDLVFSHFSSPSSLAPGRRVVVDDVFRVGGGPRSFSVELGANRRGGGDGEVRFSTFDQGEGENWRELEGRRKENRRENKKKFYSSFRLFLLLLSSSSSIRVSSPSVGASSPRWR